MKYSKIKGYKFSQLTLGTVALGMEYGISNQHGMPRKMESLEIISNAVSEGINCLDTARSYGISENIIGNFIKNNANDKINIVTKFKISRKNLDDIKKARSEVLKNINYSLSVLGIKQIPICLFHMDRHLNINKVIKILPAILSELKEKQFIDLAGISIDHPSEVKFFIEQPLIDAVQIPVNLFDQRLVSNGMIKRLHALNKIIFARSVFLQGLFFLDPQLLKGNLTKAAPYLKKIQSISEDEGISIAQLAFSYIRDMEGITSIVFGAENKKQLAQNIGLLKGKPISDKGKEAIRIFFQDVPEIIITPSNWSFR